MSKVVGSSNKAMKLIMLNGPLLGQIFNFKPGRTVQIGRVVRGNAVTIKDAGVSSKYLLIEYQLLHGHRMISDLDSYNGTFLKERLLDPFKAVHFSNGDVIEIGEATSIKVEIEVNEEESMMVNGKPPRRRGRNSACKDRNIVIELDDTDEDLGGIVAAKDDQAIFHSLQPSYSATPTNLKVIDLYIVYAISTALMG